MRVLVCGGTGFLGNAICKALAAAGHKPIVRGRHTTPKLSYTDPYLANTLADHLEEIDAVVNAVGALRNTPSRPLQRLHADAPIALFDACAQAGIRRIVQISALGIANSPTSYAATKRMADEYLLNLNMQGKTNACIVRPSIIFGSGGASTKLFTKLAALPVVLLPEAMRHCLIQPVVVQDVAQAVVQLLQLDTINGIIEIGGTQALTFEQFIASLRAQMDKRPAHIGSLPKWMSIISARIGDFIPPSPWCSESLQMLHTHNVCNPQTLEKILGRAPLALSAFYASLLHGENQNHSL